MKGTKVLSILLLCWSNCLISLGQGQVDASFPGGTDSLAFFINSRYTSLELYLPHDSGVDLCKQAETNDMKRSAARIYIDNTGQIRDISISYSQGEKDTEEIIAIIKSMPKWTPAQERKISVGSYQTIEFPYGNLTEEYVDSLYSKGRSVPMNKCTVYPMFGNDISFVKEFIRQSVGKDYPKGVSVGIQFIVNPDGSLSELRIIHPSENYVFDNEIVSILSSMPRWSPAIYKGNKVKCPFYLRYTNEK